MKWLVALVVYEKGASLFGELFRRPLRYVVLRVLMLRVRIVD